MTLLSNKENSELKKLVKLLDISNNKLNNKLNITQSKLKVSISQEQSKIIGLKSKIREIQKLEHQKSIKIQKKELEEVKQKIKDMKKREKLKIRIKEAEMIAIYNNNVLPTPLWLENNGFGFLRKIIRDNLIAFEHIKQAKRQKTIFQHVKFAEKLAEENEGQLPYALKLRQRGYISLNICIKKHPEMFAHIKQEKVQRIPEDYLNIAEEIIKKNNGELYPKETMIKLGYSYLYVCVDKYPTMFSHIKKIINAKKSRTPKEWVIVAEEIMKKNNGTLYPYKKLREIRYSGLINCMRNHPQMFKHIKPNKKYLSNGLKTEAKRKHNKALQQHKEIVKQLVEENNEKKLKIQDLRQFDQTLYSFVRKYPEEFKDIIE